MQNINIKSAKIEEAELIYNNIKQCADDMANNGLVHWIPYYTIDMIKRDIINNHVFIVELENIVIGNFILTLDEENDSIYLGKLAIIPNYEGQGIGSRCLEFIEKYAKEQNVKYIKLDVYEKSIDAIRFYKKNNYKIIGEKPTRRFIVKIMQKELR